MIKRDKTLNTRVSDRKILVRIFWKYLSSLNVFRTCQVDKYALDRSSMTTWQEVHPMYSDCYYLLYHPHGYHAQVIVAYFPSMSSYLLSWVRCI